MTKENKVDAAARQQGLLADFGQRAQTAEDLDSLLDEATAIVAESLGLAYAKLLEWRPEANDFLVRAGHGWGEDVVGKATVKADVHSSAGFALRTGEPVVSTDLEAETRFEISELLRRHGVKSAANVLVRAGSDIFGVFEVDSRERREFDSRDTAFLQGMANLLGLAIHRQRLAQENARLAERHDLMHRELQHRMLNNLQRIHSLIAYQKRADGRPDAVAALNVLDGRIAAMRRVARQLTHGGEIGTIDLGRYVVGLMGDLMSFHRAGRDAVTFKSEVVSLSVSPDTAGNVGLIANEFVTNSFKHAFGDGNGAITVRLSEADGAAILELRDDGPGMMEEIDRSGSGLQLIEMIAGELKAELDWHTDGGAVLTLRLPL